MRKGDENGSKHTVYCLLLKNFEEGGGGGDSLMIKLAQNLLFRVKSSNSSLGLKWAQKWLCGHLLKLCGD